jgi:type I restriction enzyme S subunit
MKSGHVATSPDALPNDWSVRPFGELTAWKSGGTPSKSNPEFWGGDFPWISAKSLKSFYLYDSEDRVTEAAVVDGARLADTDDILMLVRGMTLHNDVPIGIAMRPMTFNQDVKGLRGRAGVDTRFIAYWLVGNKWRLLAAVDQASHGTGRLRTEVIQEMEVPLPPPDEQRAIAGVLGALDDKIEQNRRTARTIERLARAIFRAWFVDFEPVKAKAAGATAFPSMPQPVFDALPTRLVDSAIGPVPEGWGVKQLADCVHLTMGQSPPSEYYNEAGNGLPFHQGVTDYGFRFPTHRVYCTVESRIAEPLDVLLSVRAPVGRINVADRRLVLGRGLAGLRHSNSRQSFLLHQLAHVFAEEDAVGEGTIYKAVTKRFLSAMPVLSPSDSEQVAFESLVRPLDDLVISGEVESRRLAEMRDYLLPKLLRGRVRVGEADG